MQLPRKNELHSQNLEDDLSYVRTTDIMGDVSVALEILANVQQREQHKERWDFVLFFSCSGRREAQEMNGYAGLQQEQRHLSPQQLH